jgi:hypothetical protein
MGPTHSCIEGRLVAPMPHGAWWTDVSLASLSVDAHWLASGLWHHDSELSTCCSTVRSSNSWISHCVLCSLGVAGSGSLWSKAAAATMFWLS